MIMSNKNIWYLPGPFHQYQEDVKALAKAAGLRIVDANVTESRDGECEKPPKVKLKEVAAPLVVVGDDKAVGEELIGKLQAESDAIRVLVDGLESGEILKPEAGELAIRLFDSLDHIRTKVDELAESRDQVAQERNALQAEVEALKKAAKPKPDAKQSTDKAAQGSE
jgi:FtsZ-binding cell division protein ZapB